MESEDQKKTYCHPTFTKLAAEQATKFVSDYKTRNEEEAADFFESLRKHPPNNATDQKRKSSA
jgi:hypothetical protein